MDIEIRKRRRSTVVTSTRPPRSSQAGASPRPIVVASPQRPRRAPTASVVSAHRSFEHIAGLMPPRPVVAARPVRRRPAPSAVVARIAAGPNGSMTPPPSHMPMAVPLLTRRRALQPQPIVTRAATPVLPPPHRPSIRPATPPLLLRRKAIAPQTVVVSGNLLVTAVDFVRQPVVAPRFPSRRGLPAVVAHSPFENRPVVTPSHAAIVVPRPPRRAGKPAAIVRASKPNFVTFDPVVVPRLVRPPGAAPRIARTSRAPLILTPSAPLVVPRTNLRRVHYTSVDASLNTHRAEPPPRTIVVPRLAARELLRQVSVQWAGTHLQVIAPHQPVQSPRLVRRPQPVRPILAKTHEPITGLPDAADGPIYDIIAASIAWLRLNPSIVAEFGDSPATGVPKFYSDVVQRGIAPPYLVFHEPQESESFESKDPTQRRSSVVSGVYTIEVFTTGKLTTRKLTRIVGDYLSDSPLVFSEGVLIYIKAVDRQYPTLKEAGPDTNVVLFKRAIDFEYIFERYITGL